MRKHVTFSFELDPGALRLYKDALEARDMGDLYPGMPEQWSSMHDVVDLLTVSDTFPNLTSPIVRSEIVGVSDGPPAWAPAKPGKWSRLKAAIGLGTVVVALIAASSSSAAVIEGTTSADRLVGTSAADVIRGRRGADLIRGKGGDDGIIGGPGGDTIVAGQGHDYVRSGRGNDYIDLADGRFDLLGACGSGRDVVLRDAKDFVALDCEVPDLQPDPAP